MGSQLSFVQMQEKSKIISSEKILSSANSLWPNLSLPVMLLQRWVQNYFQESDPLKSSTM